MQEKKLAGNRKDKDPSETTLTGRAMEWLNFFRDNWAAIKAAPFVVLAAAVIGGAVARWLMRLRYEGEAAANRAELSLTKAELKQTRDTAARGKDREAVAEQKIAELSDELSKDRDRIGELERRLCEVPAFKFSDRPPGPEDAPTSGTALWYQLGTQDEKQS